MLNKSLLAFFLPIFFFLAQALHAAGSEPVAEPPCSLPAPSNVQADPVGSTYATLSWVPVAGAWGYTIYLTGNGTTTTYVTTVANLNLTGLTPGITYTAEVHALCAPASESPNSATVNFNTIIIEIICQNSSCTPGTFIGSGLTIYHIWANQEPYFFWISGQNETIKYTFQKTTGNYCPIQPLSGNPSGYSLGVASGRYCPTYSGNTDQFFVSHNGDVIAMGKIEEKSISFILASGYSASVYSGVCNAMPPPAGIEAAGRLSEPGSPGAVLRPLPNPFDNELTLSGSGGTPEDPIHLSLFNAEGVLVRQEEAVIENTYTLPTDGLPAGVYFLRLRSSAGSTTHKLLKM